MARERCVHGGRRHFGVADLADHDDVGVLPECRAEAFSKCVIFGDLSLYDARQVILDRIFDGDDLYARIVHLPEERVERRRFSAPRRACVQYHAVWFRYFHFEDVHEVLIEAECFHREGDG